MRSGSSIVWFAAAAAAAAGQAQAPSAESPRVVVLGTVQDGGLPHAGCNGRHCSRARRDPARARRVASLALHLPRSGRTYLVDATPDLPQQIAEVHAFRKHPPGRTDRTPFDGVFLTHAHIGHYLGLAHFGYEVLNTRGLPVFCSPRMAALLRTSAPWSLLVERRNLELREVQPGTPLELGEGVSVTPLAVPHRDELSDTLAFRIRGPRRSLLYVPDTDSWEAWKRPLLEVLRNVDVAVLDATFYSLEELPGRDVSRIGHPLVTESMRLLDALVRKGRLEVYFTHLNHSNPALDEDGPQRRAIETRGFHVLDETDEFEL